MPGDRLDLNDILALKNNLPEGVVDILSAEELSILEKLDEENIHPDDKREIQMSLENILSSVRKNIFENIPLPTDFPFSLKPILDEFDKNSSNIGIVTKEEKPNIELIRNWIIKTLSNLNNLTEDQVQGMISLEPRTWFDGQVAVEIIPESTLKKTSKFLLSE